MKKFLSLLLISCFLIFSIVGCNDKNHNTENNTTAETTTNDEINKVNEEKYAQALVLLEQKEYVLAHEILKELGDYKDAKEMLKNFRYVLTSTVSKRTSAAGEEIGTPYTTHYIYNEDNLLIEIEASNSSATYTYDANKNMIKSVHPSSSLVKTFEYEYDVNNNIVKETLYYNETVFSIYEYTYDSNGNMIKELYYERTYEPAAYPPSLQYTLEYTYDANNLLIKKAKTNGKNVTHTATYIYDAQGKVIEESIGSDIYRYTYNESGKLLKKTLEDTTLDEYTYDVNGNLIKHTFIYSPTSSNFNVYEYTYDADGKLIREVHTEGNKAPIIYDYTYDADGNLIYKTQAKGNTIYCTYTYDINGNVIKHTVLDGEEQTQILEYTYQFIYVPYKIIEEIENIIIYRVE